jgi:hypothetical protein
VAEHDAWCGFCRFRFHIFSFLDFNYIVYACASPQGDYVSKSVPSTAGPPSLEVDFPLESAIQQNLDSLQRFTPRQRGLKGGESVEEPVGGWQRDLVNEILRRSDGTPVERGDPVRERVDEAVQFRVRKCPVDVSVSFSRVAVEIVRAKNDFDRPAAADQMW